MRVAGGAAMAATPPWLRPAQPGPPTRTAAAPAGQSPLTGYKPRVVHTDEPLRSPATTTSTSSASTRRSAAHAGRHDDEPVDGEGRRALQQAGGLPHRGPDPAVSSRSASTGSAASRRGRWSSPWIGFPLNATSSSAPSPPARPPSWRSRRSLRPLGDAGAALTRSLDWPYVEGLRMDEAMHPLTILAVGLYGQDADEPERRAAPAGRPVEVRVQEHQVDRPHPLRGPAADDRVERQNLARVRLLLEREPRGRPPALEPGARAAASPSLFASHRTQMFNGYGDQVASLYAGMDLLLNRCG
jgi:hypothetical protein